tara:strand:+ start:305 stop:661 length:357 start_codon:yes stop_codon:yes gene_type:complete
MAHGRMMSEHKGRMNMNDIGEINLRIENGEFGNPPNLQLLNAAWAEIIEEEKSKQNGNANYTSITGMWRQSGNKVAYSGRTDETITIEAGTKILLFFGEPEEGTRQPDLRLVSVTYNH